MKFSVSFQALEFFLKAEEGKMLHTNKPTQRQSLNNSWSPVDCSSVLVNEVSLTVHKCSFFPVDPDFYSKNLLMLGKTYMVMKDKQKALHWLTKAKEYPARTLEDKEVRALMWFYCVYMRKILSADVNTHLFLCRSIKKLWTSWRSWDEAVFLPLRTFRLLTTNKMFSL